MLSSVYRWSLNLSTIACIALILLILSGHSLSSLTFPVHLSTAQLQSVKTVFVSIFLEALPFILLGVFISSLLHIFVSEELLQRLIPRNPLLGVVYACMLGILLPVCECGMIPIVRRLINKGMPPYIGITYILAAPIINPVTFAATYMAFRADSEMVWYRMGLAFAVAAFIGLVLYRTAMRNPLKPAAEAEGAHSHHTHNVHANHATVHVNANRADARHNQAHPSHTHHDHTHHDHAHAGHAQTVHVHTHHGHNHDHTHHDHTHHDHIHHDHTHHDHIHHDHAHASHAHALHAHTHHDHRHHGHNHDHAHHHGGQTVWSRLLSVFTHASDEFFEMGKYLIVGAFLTAAIQTFVSREALVSLANGAFGSHLLMMGFAYLISLCSTSDAFVAASFAGIFPKGALLAFLVFGPMVDFKNTLMMLATFRSRFVLKLIVLITFVVFVGSLAAGQLWAIG